MLVNSLMSFTEYIDSISVKKKQKKTICSLFKEFEDVGVR